MSRSPLIVAIATVLLSSSSLTQAQTIQRPGDEVLPLPAFEAPEEPGPGILPAPPPARAPRRPGDVAFVLRAVTFEGNTAFDNDQLDKVVTPWIGRDVVAGDIEAMRLAVTRHYVEAGYVTSGATLPDQDVREGRVRIDIVEGRLERVEVIGVRHHRERWIARRLERAAGVPLNVNGLEEGLRMLQQRYGLERLDAELLPGARAGRAVLRLEVRELKPWLLQASGDNYEPVTVGEWAGELRAGHGSLLGLGDRLGLVGRASAGLWSIEGRYEVPVTVAETRLAFRGRKSKSRVVKVFDRLFDVEVDSSDVGVGLRHPLILKPSQDLWVGAVFDWRAARVRQSLKNDPLGLGELPGSGRESVSVLRLEQAWTHRGDRQVLALRSTVSFGLDVLDATTREPLAGGIENDVEFVTWLAQARWARRIRVPLGLDVIATARFDLQLTNAALVPQEDYALGGHASVRGYRENALVRDQGVLGSAELWVPVWRTRVDRRPILQLVPFVDVGHGWNRKGDPLARTLPSVGIGTVFQPVPWFEARLFWGYAIDRFRDLGFAQDKGIHLRVTAVAF